MAWSGSTFCDDEVMSYPVDACTPVWVESDGRTDTRTRKITSAGQESYATASAGTEIYSPSQDDK